MKYSSPVTKKHSMLDIELKLLKTRNAEWVIDLLHLISITELQGVTEMNHRRACHAAVGVPILTSYLVNISLAKSAPKCLCLSPV